MAVTVKLFAGLANPIEKKEIHLSADNVKEAFQKIIDTYPKMQKKLYANDQGKVRENLIIMKNGRNIRYLDGLETSVADGDRITIFPPIAGG